MLRNSSVGMGNQLVYSRYGINTDNKKFRLKMGI